jgi:hypothetical protein
MTTTMESNGKLRKSLSEQIDRLDAILDGLADALQGAVASAVKEAVGLAVREAVQAVLNEVVANPAVLALLQGGMPAAVTAGQRARRLWGSLSAKARAVRDVCTSLCGRLWRGLVSVGKRLTVLRHFRLQLLTGLGVGVVVATAAYFAGPWLAVAASGVGGFATTVAVQAGLWLRKACGAAVMHL